MRQLNLCQGFSEDFDPFQEEQHFKRVVIDSDVFNHKKHSCQCHRQQKDALKC